MTAAAMATPPANTPRLPGAEIAPGYVVGEHLSRGNTLDVYALWSSERDCLCIAKMLRPDKIGDADAGAKLRHEGRLLMELSHPHLVRGYAVLDDVATGPVAVLETLPGATLSSLIESDFPTGMAAGDVALLGRQLCSVLHYLHGRGQLHLDLKPSNVVCWGGKAILLDLSLAQPPGPCTAGAGTGEYMAPEQVTGGVATAATDVWGLGGVLFRALTGRRPFPRTTAERRPDHQVDFSMLDHVDLQLRDVVISCLSADPGDRPRLERIRTTLESPISPFVR